MWDNLWQLMVNQIVVEALDLVAVKSNTMSANAESIPGFALLLKDTEIWI